MVAAPAKSDISPVRILSDPSSGLNLQKLHACNIIIVLNVMNFKYEVSNNGKIKVKQIYCISYNVVVFNI